MSRIDPSRSVGGFPDRLDRHADAHVAGCDLAELVQESTLLAPSSRITAGISGGSSGTMSHRTWQIENVSTVPGRLARRSTRRWGGSSVRRTCAAAPGCVRTLARGGDDASVPHAVAGTRPSPRRRPIRRRASSAFVDGARPPRGTPRRTGEWREERPGSGARTDRRWCGATGRAPAGAMAGSAVGAHHDDGADLHQVAPRLRDPALGRAGDLPRPGVAAELPEELGDLHQPGGGDRVADARAGPPLGQQGRSPSRAVTPAAAASGALPLSKSCSPSRWCSSL